MKLYYEKENCILPKEKLYFRLDGTFNSVGPQYLWTLGKGVYGIFENEELIYVGETIASFEDRFRAHAKCIKENSINNKMYGYIRKNFEENKFYMCPLVEVDRGIKLDGNLQLRDIQAIELGFITCFKPKFNVLGVLKDYKLNDVLFETRKMVHLDRKTEIEYQEQILKLEIQLKEKDLEKLELERNNLILLK